MFSMPSGGQWLVILLIVVLLFGAKKIPELAKGLGKGIKTFKNEMDSNEPDIKEAEKLADKADIKASKSEAKQNEKA